MKRIIERFWGWLADKLVGDITYWSDLTEEPDK